MSITLTPEPLSKEAFAPFGDVIETDGSESYPINFGRTQRFHALATVEAAKEGKAGINIFRAQALERPFRVEVMERHPLGSQAFICMERQAFMTLVAPKGIRPEPEALRLFLVGENQGINLHRGTWHHYLFSLEHTTDFLCIDRIAGEGNNCDEYWFEEEIWVGS